MIPAASTSRRSVTILILDNIDEFNVPGPNSEPHVSGKNKNPDHCSSDELMVPEHDRSSGELTDNRHSSGELADNYRSSGELTDTVSERRAHGAYGLHRGLTNYKDK